MKLGPKMINVYPWDCDCGQKLYFEDSDFETKEIDGFYTKIVKTPCPICGKVWSNLEKEKMFSRLIEDN